MREGGTGAFTETGALLERGFVLMVLIVYGYTIEPVLVTIVAAAVVVTAWVGKLVFVGCSVVVVGVVVDGIVAVTGVTLGVKVGIIVVGVAIREAFAGTGTYAIEEVNVGRAGGFVAAVI